MTTEGQHRKISNYGPTVKLVTSLGNELGIALIQIESPFGNELCAGDDPHSKTRRHILFWRDYETRVKKIMDIISHTVNRYETIHIITLPEYSVPHASWEDLKRLSDKHNIIIIGGSDYDASLNKNIAPIFLPEQKTLYLAKESQSYYESNIFFDKALVNQKNYYNGTVKLQWKDDSENDYELQVVICSDYFHYSPFVNQNIIGIIICPMCSPQVKKFYGMAEFLIGLAEPKYVLLTNAVSSPSSALKIEGNSGICFQFQMDCLIIQNWIIGKEFFMQNSICTQQGLKSQNPRTI